MSYLGVAGRTPSQQGKVHPDADSCNAVDTCNFVGGACYEKFEQNGFKCTLTPSMLSDIHSNTQYNPTSLDDGNPMYGKQCTDADTCPNYDCVVGDKCTNPTQLEYVRPTATVGAARCRQPRGRWTRTE